MNYFKPKSVTWWAGIGLTAMGVALAAHEGFDLGGFGVFVDALVGGQKPATLIGQGMGLVGLRGALQ